MTTSFMLRFWSDSIQRLQMHLSEMPYCIAMCQAMRASQEFAGRCNGNIPNMRARERKRKERSWNRNIEPMRRCERGQWVYCKGKASVLE